MTKTILTAIPLIFLCTGCLIKELNAGHYEAYYDGGLAASDSGDFATAKRRFGTAYYYAQVGHLGPGAEAAARYNYALAVGRLGDFSEAENCLKETMALDEKAEGKDGVHASMRLFELARLYQAWGKYSQAIEMYERAFLLADKRNAKRIDPIGYAIVLSDYAMVLKKNGFEQKAESVEFEAQKIRDTNSGIEPKVKIHYYPAK